VHAHELLLTAQPIPAARALEIGLLNRIVPAAGLLDAAFAYADAIAANAPLAVRATRAGVRELLALPLEEAWQRQEELGRPLRKTDDAREAQAAFVEKRKPFWKGTRARGGGRSRANRIFREAHADTDLPGWLACSTRAAVAALDVASGSGSRCSGLRADWRRTRSTSR
jgi:hypothetical protein